MNSRFLLTSISKTTAVSHSHFAALWRCSVQYLLLFCANELVNSFSQVN